MDKSKNLFKCRYLILISISIIIYLCLNYVFEIESSLLITINSVVFSVIASFLVGVYFQFKLKDEISQEHLKIIEHKDEFNKSGIIKYCGSFKDILEDLRFTMREAKNITIYVTYGSTILNTLNEEISHCLSRKNRTLKLFLLDIESPFIKGYEQLWNYKEGALKNKIQESIKLLKNKISELNKQNELKGELEIYSIKKYPVNYSFYICDDLIYFVPSKHYESKEFVPLVIKAQKTIDKNALYNKICRDIELIMNSEQGIQKMNDLLEEN